MEAPSTGKSKSRKSDKEKKAKKSGVRTKFLIESLRNDYYSLREENDRLRKMVETNLPEEAADAILADCFDPNNAPKAKAASIDELANKMSSTGVSEGDDNDDDDDEEDY
jgi:cell shape-determining protein MreC